MSPDLTPMDFSFWNYIKKKVADTKPESRAELRAEIEVAMKTIPANVVTSMCQGVQERCRKCLNKNGRRFEKDVEE